MARNSKNDSTEPNPLTHVDADGRPMIVHDDIVWNLALGSNMDVEKLRARNPKDRKPINPLLPGVPATVPGWALSFDLLAVPPSEPAMAGAIPVLSMTGPSVNGATTARSNTANTLHGILYKLTREDYTTLSMSEGCWSSDRTVPDPHSQYQEVCVEAFPYPSHALVGGDEGQVPERVFAVIFALRRPPTQPLKSRYIFPSKRYVDLLIKGSKAAELDPEYIRSLESHPVARLPGPALKVLSRLFYIAYRRLMSRKWSLALARRCLRSVVCNLYSKREQAHDSGRLVAETIWHMLLLLYMFPVATLGFFVGLLTGRAVFRIIRGLPE